MYDKTDFFQKYRSQNFLKVLMRPVFSAGIKNSFSFLLFIGKCTTFGYPVNL